MVKLYKLFIILSCFLSFHDSFALKILFITHQFPKFIQPFILQRMTGMIDKGHNVYIYSDSRYDKLIPEVVMRYNLFKKTFFKQLPKNFRADVIICEFGIDGLRALELKREFGLRGPMITCFRGNDLSAQVKKIPKKYEVLFERGNFFLPVCKYFEQKLISLNCPKEKIVVLHSAIDCQKFKYNPAHLRNDDKIRIVTNSRLVEKKGIEYAVRAFAELVPKHPNIELIVIGDGTLKNQLVNLIYSLNIQDHVRMTGWLSHEQIVEVLNLSHLFIHPAITASDGDEEGIPNSVKEAMAVGLPVISTHHSGIPELIIDGENGFMVPEKDIQALANKIDFLLDHKAMWGKLALAGRQKIEKEFNMDIENDKLDAICRAIVQRRNYEECKFDEECA